MYEPDRALFDAALSAAPVAPPIGAGRADPAAADAAIGRFLRAARTHLDLQVAYVSEIVGNESVFRHVDAPGLEALVQPGDRKSLDDVYCRHILEGRLPELIPDTAAVPLASAMPITAAVPIGAHVSVPLRLPDGGLYGMFCCLGPAADPSLNRRDLAMMRTLADLAGQEIARGRVAADMLAARRVPIDAALRLGTFSTVYQPIWKLGTARPIGFESLTRFEGALFDGLPASPDQWFSEAAAVGLGEALELAVIDRALAALASLPKDHYLTINASPSTACGAQLASLLARHDLGRLVLEVTEQERFQDFGLLADALAGLRAGGLRLAVDDAGAGYAGLQQIIRLKPDIIKLDRFFVTGIDRDPARRALAAALAEFASQVGCQIVAEGVEVDTELAALDTLGFRTIQGYLLGKPQPLAGALALVTA